VKQIDAHSFIHIV